MIIIRRLACLRAKIELSSNILAKSHQYQKAIISQRIQNVKKFSTVADLSINIKTSIMMESFTKTLSHISTCISTKNRVYKNDLANAMTFIESVDNVSLGNSITLIKCCSGLLVDVAPKKRMILLNKLCDLLENKIGFDVDHYNEILNCYADNDFIFNAKDFLTKMKKNCKPSIRTYELLVKALCMNGDMKQVEEVLEIIKNDGFLCSANIYNSIIEGYGRARNISAALDAAEKIRSTLINRSEETELSVIIAHICCKDENAARNHLKSLKEWDLILSERQLTDIIKCSVINNMITIIPDVISMLSPYAASTVSFNVLHMCIQLIHQGYEKSVFEIYKYMSTRITDRNNIKIYKTILIKEMIRSSNNVDEIISLIENVQAFHNDLSAIYIGLEFALRNGNSEIALPLMHILIKNNEPIRSHYFWPLFVSTTKIKGEAGIFELISQMQSFNIIPDVETLTDYVIPNISIVDPVNLVKKFNTYGLSSTDCLTPLLIELLKNNNIEGASDLCELTTGKLDCSRLFPFLANAFFSTYDIDSTHNLLKCFVERNIYDHDYVGKFLVYIFNQRKWECDTKQFSRLISALSESDTKISLNAVEKCIIRLNKLDLEGVDVEHIRKNLSIMVDKNMLNDRDTGGYIKWGDQANMNTEQLEAHLIELKSKGMKTRGVLRKLLQNYCQFSELEKAKDILKECEKENITFSSGMKTSVMMLFIRSLDIDNAMKWYENVKSTEPNFVIDEFKLLDLATLLVKNNKKEEAIKLLNKESTKRSIRWSLNLETNCWNLLNATATKYDPNETKNMLSFLVKSDFCKYSNILLGPLVRAHLLKNDIHGAVEEFVDCTKRYRKTPLKHELLKILIKGSSDYKQSLNPESANLSKEDGIEIQNDYKNLLVTVQEADKNVHGVTSAKIALITGLADCGLSKPLRRYVQDPNLYIGHDQLYKQCERFYAEKKVDALRLLAECFEGVDNIRRDEIYELIFKIYQINDDCDGAIKTFNSVLEQNLNPTKESIVILTSMLKTNNKIVPESLLSYIQENRIEV